MRQCVWVAFIASFALVSCQSTENGEQSPFLGEPPILGSTIENNDSLQAGTDDRQPVLGTGREPDIQSGSGAYFARSLTTSDDNVNDRDSREGETFIFRSASIDLIVNEVLGSFELSYTISPDVRGEMSLRLEGIANADEAIAGLDAALGLQGYEVRMSGPAVLIGRKGSLGKSGGEAPFFLEPTDKLPDGSTATVLQLKYARTDDVLAIAQPLLTTGIVKGDDDARGFILLQGEASDVSTAVEVLRSLDVNWYDAVSTGIFPVDHMSPGELAAELSPLLDRIGGVTLVPVERLQVMIVIARNDDVLGVARSWIDRLDEKAGPRIENDILVYEVRHSDADILAQLIGSSTNRNFGRATEPAPAGSDYQGGSVPSEPGGGAFRQNRDRLQISVDISRNAIVARGEPSELADLQRLFEMLDQPQRQVIIEAMIVEVQLTGDHQFGIQWRLVEDKLSAAFSDTASSLPVSLFPGVSISYTNVGIDAVLNALASTSNVEIVSAPRIMVLNNETAKLQIGDQVPVITQSAVSITDPGAPVVNSTSYRDTGVILTVTPSIRSGGMVMLEVAQEVSGVAETTTSNIDSPTITQRSIESKLVVRDGSTAVLGGLLSTTRSQSNSGIPVLKDAPVVGRLFGSTSNNQRRTELVILISPTIVMGDEVSVDLPLRLREALIRARGE